MRSVLFRFPDLDSFERLMRSTSSGGSAPGRAIVSEGATMRDLELDSPLVEPFDDGEWVLAVFEVGPHLRAASAAAHVAVRPDGVKIVLEPRDCLRLADFAYVEAARPPAPKGSAIAEEGGAPSTERSASSPPERNASNPPEPRTAAPQPPPAPGSMPPRSAFASSSGARVLVVDDDDTIRDMVSAMLEAVGLIVTAVPSAEDALDLFAEESFELLVLDWNMPRMTGIDLCRTLRQRPGLATLPVLFLTSNTSPSDMVEAFAAGADDYVEKPFRAPELGARIFSLLRRARFSSAG